METFVEGRTYQAIPALEGAKRRLVVCVGRDKGQVVFSWADNLTVEHTEMCVGREIMKSNRPEGVYVVSSAVPVNLESAAPVIDLLSVRGVA